ncbi:unnamed protein product [Nesidiocoris tenuis]|uniref:Uncharacterized protein n=1 Tax=Nesidiocoris tenuis TaxID=355587 RepID=A0A6H5HP23_9HEMI|nr:unnamed protein product [Nesidiocoris tenuis]
MFRPFKSSAAYKFGASLFAVRASRFRQSGGFVRRLPAPTVEPVPRGGRRGRRRFDGDGADEQREQRRWRNVAPAEPAQFVCVRFDDVVHTPPRVAEMGRHVVAAVAGSRSRSHLYARAGRYMAPASLPSQESLPEQVSGRWQNLSVRYPTMLRINFAAICPPKNHCSFVCRYTFCSGMVQNQSEAQIQCQIAQSSRTQLSARWSGRTRYNRLYDTHH